MCEKYTQRFPEGTISKLDLTKIELTFSIPVKAGTGTISIFGPDGSFQGSYSASSFVIQDNTASLYILSGVFLANTQYSVEVSEGSILATDDSPIASIPSSDWKFTVSADELQALFAIINSGIRGIEIAQDFLYTLDGSFSYDPENLNLGISYSWRCENYTTNFNTYISSEAVSYTHLTLPTNREV